MKYNLKDVVFSRIANKNTKTLNYSLHRIYKNSESKFK